MRAFATAVAGVLGGVMFVVCGMAVLLSQASPDAIAVELAKRGATSPWLLHPPVVLLIVLAIAGLAALLYAGRRDPLANGLSKSTSHGSARYSTTEEVREMGHGTGGVPLCMEDTAEFIAARTVLGKRYWKLKKAAPVIATDEHHVLVEGPTGAGKDECVLYPTLLTDVFRSHVVYDPKGKAYAKTSGFRSVFSVVFRFAPCDPRTHRYNPLLEIPLGTDLEVTEAKRIASILADAAASEEKSSRIFLKSCVLLVTCAILHVMHRCDGKDRSLPGVFRLLTSRGRDAVALVDWICANPVPSAVDTANALKVLAVDKRMIQSAFTTMLDVLDFCTMPLVADAISGSDFVATDLSKRKKLMTLYLVFPFKYADVLRPLARLMLDGLLSSHEFEREHDTCYDLNEVASPGNIPAISRSIAEIREYGVQLVLYVQSESQLYTCYGKDAAVTILDNCRVRVTLGVSGLQATDNASKRMGKTTLVRPRKTQAVSNKSLLETTVTNTTGEGEQARELMTGTEVQTLPSSEVLVELPELHAYKGKRIWRYATPLLQQRSEIAPPTTPHRRAA